MSLGSARATEQACGKSELDVFQPVNVQVALTDGRWHTYQPLSAITSPPDFVEFVVPGTANETIDLNNISVYIKGKLTKEDGTKPTDNKVGIANNFLGSLFRHVDLSLNGQLLTRASREYAYKDYLCKLLYYQMPKGGKEGTQNDCIGWYPDKPSYASTAGTNNTGWVVREAWIGAGKSFELRGPVGLDLFNSDRLLFPGVDMNIKFHFNNAKFFGMNPTTAGEPFKLEISRMELIVRRVTIGDSFINQLQKTIQEKDAIYPFTRREIASFSLAKGETSAIKENIFRGQLATRYFVALVDSAAFNGTSWENNPYEFKHFNLSEVAVLENDQCIAGQPLQMSFINGKETYLKAYYQLLESIGGVGERALIPQITKEAWAANCCIFAFTRAPDLCHGDAALPTQIGNVTLRLNFSSALTNSVTAIVMAEFDSRIQINQDKNIITDYAV